MVSLEAIKELLQKGLSKLGLVNTSGTQINPATEDTLSSLRSDFNTKVPSPFTIDGNGNLMIAVNVDNVGLATEATQTNIYNILNNVFDSVLNSFRTHSTSDEVYDRTVDVPSFISSGMEYAYTTLSLKVHQLVRGAEFVDIFDVYNGGGITLAYGGYLELGGV